MTPAWLAVKRERRRVKRIRVIKGRLIAWGSKSLPEDVRLDMAAARRERWILKMNPLPAQPAAAPEPAKMRWW